MTMIEVSSNDLISLEKDFKRVRDKLDNLKNLLETDYKELKELDLYENGFTSMKGHIASIYEALEKTEKNIYGFDEEIGYLEEAYTNKFDDLDVPIIRDVKDGELVLTLPTPEVKEEDEPEIAPKPEPTVVDVDKDVDVEVDKVKLADITKKKGSGGDSYEETTPIEPEETSTQYDTLNELLDKSNMGNGSVTSSINASASNIVGGEL